MPPNQLMKANQLKATWKLARWEPPAPLRLTEKLTRSPGEYLRQRRLVFSAVQDYCCHHLYHPARSRFSRESARIILQGKSRCKSIDGIDIDVSMDHMRWITTHWECSFMARLLRSSVRILDRIHTGFLEYTSLGSEDLLPPFEYSHYVSDVYYSLEHRFGERDLVSRFGHGIQCHDVLVRRSRPTNRASDRGIVLRVAIKSIIS